MKASDWIALAALLVAFAAVYFSRSQAGSTRWQAIGTMHQAASVNDAYHFSRATAYAGIIMNFVTRFLDLAEREDPKEVFRATKQNDRWVHHFWALYTIEFWYFHHRMLPVDMYTYWMGVLSELYADNDAVYASHKAFLTSYEHTYPEMAEFFEQVHNLAENNANPAERNRQVQEHVERWIRQNYADIELDQDGRVIPPS